MNGVFAAAIEIQEFLQERQWHFAIIGGIAVIRWGAPQATQDVDVSLLTGFGEEEPFVDALLARFPGRFPDAREFAVANRVLLLRAGNGVDLDVALAAIPFEQELIARASDFAFVPGVTLRTCSAEDLVVLKAFAGRDKDWAAVRGVLVRQEGKLDWDRITSRLEPLCEAAGTADSELRLARLRSELQRKQ